MSARRRFGLSSGFSIPRQAEGEPSGTKARRNPVRFARLLLASVLLTGVGSSLALVSPSPVAASLGVPLFSQRNGSWSGNQLGTCSTTIGVAGCAVTAEAMVFSFYGVSVSSSAGSGMNPAILNAWLRDNGGYAPDPSGGNCLVNWGTVPSGINYTGTDSYLNTSKLNGELAAGRPVIAQVHGSGTTMHFVVITGQNGSTYDINDPWNGDQRTLNNGDLGSYAVDALRYFSGSGGGGSCTAPPLNSPGNGATVSSDTITFSWGNVGCSHNGWTLRVRTDTNFDDPNGNHLYDQGVGQTELSRQVTINGHDNQTLYWALRTANPVGPWTIWSFRISPSVSCTAPPLSSPGNGASVTSDTITFSWGNVGCSHNGWTLRVRTDTNFDDPNGNHLYDQGVGQTELSRQVTINGHDNQTLYWALRTANPVGPWTIWSFRISPTISPPGAPGNPSATAISSTQIQLSWTYASGAAGYRIKRWDGISSWPVLADNLNSGYSSYVDGNLTPGATYWYFICAFNSGGETCITDWVTTTLPVSAPSAPGNVAANGISASQIQLTWSGASGASGYRVKRWDGATLTWPTIVDNLSSGMTSYVDGGLSANSGYSYYVCAFNSGGETCNSPYVSGTTQAAQVTWSVSLQASQTTATTGTSVTLTAVASQDVGPTIYYIWIVASDGTVFGECGTGTTCTASVSSSTVGSVTYYAVVADGNGAAQQAVSGGVIVTWTLPWSVTLEASATAVAAGSSVTLTAVADQDVGPTPYYILILTSDGYLAGTPCGTGTICTAVVSSGAAGSQTYHALVANYTGSSAQATSGSVTVTWRAVHLVLSPANATKNPGESQTYAATAVDSAGNSLGDVTSVTTFTISGGGSCAGSSCTSTVAGDHTVTGIDGAATGTAALHITGVQGVVTGATFYPLTPKRLLDSRDGTGGLGIFHSHVAQTFQVTGGSSGVPSTATAVTGNLTVTQQTTMGFLYVGPVAMNNPTSSTLNFPYADDRANAVTAALGGEGTLSITYAAPSLGQTAHVIFDVTGYFVPNTLGATYHALTPKRILDSRDGTGGTTIFSSHAAQHFQVTGGSSGVPSNATAVTGNLTVTGQGAGGYLYVGPVQANNPTSSTVNFPAGDDRANAVTVSLGAGGVLWVTYAAPTLGPAAHVIFDVTGYFTPDMTGATYVPVAPTRILDSRDGTGATTIFGSHQAQDFQVTGAASGVPANAVAVTGNLTVTQQTTNGFLYIGPNQADNPTSSTLNFPYGDDRANAVDVALGSGGCLWVTYAGPVYGPTAHAIFDVTGYFLSASS